jgi:hypothetical protein
MKKGSNDVEIVFIDGKKIEIGPSVLTIFHLRK